MVFHGNADIQDFPGNYTQYREWREAKEQLEREAQALEAAKRPDENKKGNRPVREEKRKLSFKERKEYESLESEKAELEQAMSSGTLSNEELLQKSERISWLINAIDEKSTRWLELSEWA